MIALLCGGGEGVLEEVHAARMLCGMDARHLAVVAVNDVGAVLPHIDHWVTMDPIRFREWQAARASAGIACPHTRWSLGPSPFVHRWIRNWIDGSSGLLGLDIVLNGLRLRGAILCGMPMDGRPNAFRPARRSWSAYDRYRPAWLALMKDVAPYVRSMSGWTAERFGMPTPEWMRSLAELEPFHALKPARNSNRPMKEVGSMGDKIAIHHPQDPNRPTVIRKDRFDPKIHKVWREPGAAKLPAIEFPIVAEAAPILPTIDFSLSGTATEADSVEPVPMDFTEE